MKKKSVNSRLGVLEDVVAMKEENGQSVFDIPIRELFAPEIKALEESIIKDGGRPICQSPRKETAKEGFDLDALHQAILSDET